MKLSKIKLAGFKSFVDPTTIPLPSNLCGIIGPNGCGKSNTIDAVRWVMGESSAKNLRGESMADVIFNGSHSRKPVGQASVELIFDNADASLGGQWSQYNEISVKRLVTRDGQSNYYLNGTRCRRRDITDIFLGTGLGPRSYAIIEQGMITRVIDARPEDLRGFLEEAAGISKYKERRKETETRIRHTRENLDRLTDLRDELEKQLQRLQRQAATAERYKELKADERRLRSELLALRWHAVDLEAEQRGREIRERETALEAAVAAQRSIESALEREREAHAVATENLNAAQGRFYGVGAEISRAEQAIQHHKELKRRHEQELARAEQGWDDLNRHIERDRSHLDELHQALAALEPELAAARGAEQEAVAAREAAERAMERGREGWEEHQRHAARAAQAAQVERTRVEAVERQLERLQQRRERLDEERGRLSGAELEEEIEALALEEAEWEEQGARLAAELATLQEEILAQRGLLKELTADLDSLRTALQAGRGRLASLEALQQAALGKRQGRVTEWLARQGLADAPRLAQGLTVASGWERAVETVLGPTLEAVCVAGLDGVVGGLEALTHGHLTLVETGPAAAMAPAPGERLLAKVTAPWSLEPLLGAVVTAEGLDEALALRGGLAPHQSVITRDGLWLGPGWLRVARQADEHAGVLAREQELRALAARLEEEGARAAEREAELEEGRARLHALEQRRDATQAEAQQATRRHGELRARLGERRGRLEQLHQRAERIGAELAEVAAERARDREELEEGRLRLQEAVEEMELLAARRDELAGERERLREALDAAREEARRAREATHALALQVEAKRTARSATEQALGRMEEQLAGLSERREELRGALLEGDEPLLELAGQLEELLTRRLHEEAALTAARERLEEVEQALRRLEQERLQAERRGQEARTALEEGRMRWQELKVRRDTLQEQLAEGGFELRAVAEALPPEAEAAEWERRLEAVTRQVERLGPINLAAIDEYAEQKERKIYLDAQHNDLVEALETLENAIRRIDRETRARFKETFDRVNAGVQRLFPRLFGGGQAFLELTGEDLLDTGVAIMARPPGKNIRSIHLLSGGEKALTAVSLVFAIFELNPAPFCMLDEVDAPLDEANVGRFSQLIKEKSAQVQFIFITHNKATMEVADHLMGVTMHEPGVSRLVAVDVEEAVKLAAQ